MDEIKNICRLCLEYPDDHILIENKYSDELTFLDIFNQITGLNATLNDELSQLVCIECVEDLKFAYDIITRAKRSDHILKIMAEKKIFSIVEDNALPEETNPVEDVSTHSNFIDDPKNSDDQDSIFNNESIAGYATDSDHENTIENKDFVNQEIYDRTVNESDTENAVEIKNEVYFEISLESNHSSFSKNFDGESSQEAAEYVEPTEIENPDSDKCDVEENFIYVVEEEDNIKIKKDSENTTTQPVFRFMCEICGKTLRSSQHLKIHKYTHTNEKNFACKICSRRFATVYRLRDHVKIHSEEKRFTCKYCDKKFASQNSLTCHTRRHTGERPFSCKICGKSFSQTSILKTHLTLHTGKTVECPTCGKAFSRSSHLILHQRDHTGERPYVCHICQKTYKQKSHLDRHLDTHMGVKHKCDICSKEYSKKSTLNLHIRAHNAKKFKCDQCPAEFKSPIRHQRHLKKHESSLNKIIGEVIEHDEYVYYDSIKTEFIPSL